ncbi:MAG TPA: DNA polymerase III subunit delta [Flavobacterium sp.]|nr:DNA polymerase III subunit delta [Flavobacterium sp.]
MDEVTRIINDVKSGNIKPIYFLMGEEPYYIDKITEFLENNILTEDEKGFNQTVVYGRDTTIGDIVLNAKRYPMMAERQVLIVKEAQELSKDIDNLTKYAENFQPTTVLVFAYKYKTLDNRKKLSKLIKENGVLFESSKLYDNQIATWITRVLKGSNYSIEPKAAIILSEFLGTDLSRISNELEKLKIILPPGTTITPQHIEENIGFSKDYNVFELRNAIGARDELKAYRIANYFASNPKEHPIILTNGLLFSFFSQLLQFHGLKDKSQANVTKVLKIRPFFFKDFELAVKNFSMKKVSYIVGILRDIDMKSKGVGAAQMHDSDLLKELLIKIFKP